MGTERTYFFLQFYLIANLKKSVVECSGRENRQTRSLYNVYVGKNIFIFSFLQFELHCVN